MDIAGRRTVGHNVHNFADWLLKSRHVEAMHADAPSYAINRWFSFAARLEVDVLFDDLALSLGFRARHFGNYHLILDGEGIFIDVYGMRKTDYCSCSVYLWADSLARIDLAREAILARVGAARITEPMFTVNWTLLDGRGELESASIEEMANDVLHDAAYPQIAGGVGAFIDRYLESPDTILVLQGPPGTGKSRLIRAILGEVARRKGDDGAEAMYTADQRTVESDAIFVRFITGDDDVFVIEDADYLLQPRSSGNDLLHRFLAIADGVVRAQGRKIIFSTNLPNVGNLDDALVRPGRCFARVFVRELTPDEAAALAVVLCQGDAGRVGCALATLSAGGKKTHSLAEVYRAIEMSRVPAHAQ